MGDQGVGWGGGVSQGICERRSEVFVKIKNNLFCGGGWSGRGSGWGVRVDVNEKLKLLRKFK